MNTLGRGWINFDCPFCSPGWRHYRMGYNCSNGYVTCWLCGWHSLTLKPFALLAGVSVGEAAALLKGLTPTPGSRSAHCAKLRCYCQREGNRCTSAHKEYLEGRGFEVKKLIRLWHLEGIAQAVRLSWRIFIPAYLNDDMVSWTTRAIVEGPLKYLSAGEGEESVPLKHILYGEQFCCQAIVICEGPFDVWAIGPGAVATCGVSYTRAQMLRMVKYPVRVVLFDAEEEAQRRAEEYCVLT